MKELSLFLQRFGDTAKHRIIDFLLENPGVDYTKAEIAKHAGISRPALYAVWKGLEKDKLVKHTRIIGRARLFTFNKESEAGKFYYSVEMMLLKESFAAAEAMVEKQKVVA